MILNGTTTCTTDTSALLTSCPSTVTSLVSLPEMRFLTPRRPRMPVPMSRLLSVTSRSILRPRNTVLWVSDMPRTMTRVSVKTWQTTSIVLIRTRASISGATMSTLGAETRTTRSPDTRAEPMSSVITPSQCSSLNTAATTLLLASSPRSRLCTVTRWPMSGPAESCICTFRKRTTTVCFPFPPPSYLSSLSLTTPSRSRVCRRRQGQDS